VSRQRLPSAQSTRFNECDKNGHEKRKNKEELVAKKFKMHKWKSTARGDAQKRATVQGRD